MFCNSISAPVFFPRIGGHNPCFSGQCFAIKTVLFLRMLNISHNPCFSGQCFAIPILFDFLGRKNVTILVLVDSVLQLGE